MKLLLAVATAMLATGAAAPSDRPFLGRALFTDEFAMLDGTWTGTATLTLMGGGTRRLRHTERVGPMLGGQIRVIEGKSYEADGREAGFNAFAVISSGDNGTYEFRSYAQGHSGTFPLTATGTGFAWSMQAGPTTFRYTAVVKDGVWHEEGVMVPRPGAAPLPVITLDLKRTGDTDWPAAGAVTPAQ